jgi:hypothetical protein
MQCACALLYYQLWSARLFNHFAHYLINGTIFENNNVFEHRVCVLSFFFFLQILSEAFLILRRTEGDMI